jgi:O-antigen ligase
VRFPWTGTISVLKSFQLAVFLAWMVLIVRPGDVPDPFAVGVSWSLTALCLVTAGIILIPELIAGRWPSTTIDRVLALYFVLAVLISLASIRSLDQRAMMAATLQLLGNIGIFYATRVLVQKIPWLAQGILLLLVASIGVLLWMALAYHAGVGLHTRPVAYPVPEGWSGYPELSLLAVMQFGLLVAGLQTTRRTSMAIVAAGLIVMNLVELALLYSRASWLTIGLVALAAASVTARRRQLTRLLATVGVVAVAGLVLFLVNPTLRYLTATMVTGGAAPPAWARDGFVRDVATPGMRIEIWQRTLRMISDHPVRGVGFGNFQEVFEGDYNAEPNRDQRRGVHAHNLWLQQFAELGVLGGAVYIVLWVRILTLCWRSAREHPDFLSVGLLLSIVAIFGSNLTTNMFFLTGGASGRLQSLTWMLFGLAAAKAMWSDLRFQPETGPPC